MSSQSSINEITVTPEATGNISVYFVPPITTNFMQWGESILVILFLLALFALISYLYIYMNINDYQTRISIMTNGYLFGFDPQEKFKQFISDTQAEAITTAMGSIAKSTNTLNTSMNRMDDQSTRLTQQVSNDTKNTSTNIDNLGKMIQDNVGKLGGILEKLGGVLVLNGYMKDGALKTTQVAPGSSLG